MYDKTQAPAQETRQTETDFGGYQSSIQAGQTNIPFPQNQKFKPLPKKE